MGLPSVPVTDVTHAVPADFGILSPAASVVFDTDPHWSNGFSYESLDCGTLVTLSSICSSASGVTAVAPTPGDKWREYRPFSIEASFECSTLGSQDYEKQAADRLEACQQKAVEREFWTGDLAKLEQAQWDADGVSKTFPNRFLASASATDVTPTPGTAIKVRHGLALLEDALGDCGCGVRGTIHATRGVASTMGLGGSDGVLRTGLGNLVIAGAGYTGSGPNGNTPSGTQAWMYATGPLTVRLGPVTAVPGNRKQATNTSTNSVKVFADRPAAVTFDTCCHYAVLVDLSLDYA